MYSDAVKLAMIRSNLTMTKPNMTMTKSNMMTKSDELGKSSSNKQEEEEMKVALGESTSIIIIINICQ